MQKLFIEKKEEGPPDLFDYNPEDFVAEFFWCHRLTNKQSKLSYGKYLFKLVHYNDTYHYSDT
jgi:hypothetical protein